MCVGSTAEPHVGPAALLGVTSGQEAAPRCIIIFAFFMRRLVLVLLLILQVRDLKAGEVT